MAPAAALLVLLAQEGTPTALGDPGERSQVSLSIVQRFSVPDGELGGGADFDDLFDLGYGFGVQVDYLVPAGLGWRYGPYFDLGWDVFGGQEETVGGVRLEADPLAVFNAIAGIKAAVDVDPHFFLEFRAGAGLAHFLSTDAELEGTGAELELIEASTEIAGELGMRAGFKLGKLMKLDYGFGARVRGSAEEGEIPVDPETLIQYFMDVGVGFRF